ncbi:MAG TPA: peptide deformylase [Nevskiaceae bacterium]|nr:peptide deformylase [Nevskiaceae bacterium]
MIRAILKMGDERLLAHAKAVKDVPSAKLDALVADLFETMRAAGGVGLAAPQIGVGLRVVIFGFERSERYPNAEPVPQTVLVNPVVTPIGDEKVEGWEGCLSVPGLRGVVPRFQRVHYRGVDAQGAVIDRIAEGFHARVVQHECDHLDGVLYPMRIADFTRFGYTDVLFPEVPAEGAARNAS